MRDRTLHRLFERYRRRGDVAALGDLFDAVAPELQRVAASLVRDVSAADDLVQATFLTAIEKAEAWDASRRLVPWLMGILVRHAHAARRDAARTPDPSRVMEDRGEPEDPTRAAERAEAEAALRRAVEALPERYREVLAPFVFEGERAAEIAARLGRAPGVVRMQQSRGFDLLRRSLSSALVLGLVAELGGAGLRGVRSRVMDRAARRAPELVAAVAAGSAAAAGASTLPGAFALTAKTLAAAAAAAALVLGLVHVSDLGAQPADLGSEEALAPRDDRSATLERPSDAPRAGLDLTPGGRPGAAREDAPTTSEAPDVAAVDADVAAAQGRVLDASGEPVVGVAVELIAVDLTTLERGVADVFEPLAPPAHVAARTVTDVEGAFRFDRVPLLAATAIGVDLGGAQPYARLVDEGLARAERTLLTDIVLPPSGRLEGRCVDGAGQPVAGARVRVGVVEAPERWGYHASVRPGAAVRVSVGILSAVLDLPPWFEAAERLLPVATTYADGEGRFRFERAPAEGAHLFVDHPGLEGLALDLVDARVERDSEGALEVSERQLGDVVLSLGRVIRGRVLDDAGEPVSGAEVRAGTQTTLGWGGPDLALLAQSTVSDGAGDFELTGLDPDEDAILAVRLAAGEPWSASKVGDDGFQTVKVLARHDVSLSFVDDAGEPVDGVELRVRKPGVLAGLVPGGALLDPWTPVGEPEALGDGRWSIAGLARGTYTVTARAEGYTAQEFRLRSSRSSARRDQQFVLERGTPLTLRVVDAESEEPVAGARVALLADVQRDRMLAEARTDARGEATVSFVAGAVDDDARLRVAHPAYGTRLASLGARADEEVHVVRLAAAGAVEVQVTFAPDGGPAAGYMVTLDQPRGRDADSHPLLARVALSGSDGAARFGDVPPGTWRLLVHERVLDGAPLELLRRGIGFWEHATEVVVEPGAAAQVDARVLRPGAPTLPTGTGELLVRVTRDGVPLDDRVVRLVGTRGVSGHAQKALDEAGTARFTGLPEGALRVSVGERKEMADVLSLQDDHLETIELTAGEIRELSIEFDTAPLLVRVVDERGAPLPDAPVSLSNRRHGHYRFLHSDESGNLRVDDWHAGETGLSVDEDEFGVGGTTLEAVPGRLNEARLEVILGVPCAGELALPEGSPDVFAFIHLYPVPGSEPRVPAGSAVVECEDGRGRFEIRGVRPGRYVAVTTWGAPSGRLSNVEFDLSASGSTSLRLSPRLID